jgi:hypothetical protein
MPFKNSIFGVSTFEAFHLAVFQVENCLMLSEYEQNLIKETEGPFLGKRRKWSLVRQPSAMLHGKFNPGPPPCCMVSSTPSLRHAAW